jgi:tetratricopeptide repeat protein 21B
MEATKIMEAGYNQFRNTPEEVRFIIANADFALKRGDSELALSMLSQVTSDKP